MHPISQPENQRHHPNSQPANQRHHPISQSANQRHRPISQTANQRRVPVSQSTNQRHRPISQPANQRRIPSANPQINDASVSQTAKPRSGDAFIAPPRGDGWQGNPLRAYIVCRRRGVGSNDVPANIGVEDVGQITTLAFAYYNNMKMDTTN